MYSILLVDDEPMILRVMRVALEKVGYRVITAVDGKDALDKLEASHPDILITDASRELWFQHEFDAIATIRVAVYQANFEKDRTEWDGVKQKLERKGRNRGYAGKVYVSSVSFEVYDRTDKLMYVNYGGLELLQTRNEAQLIPIPAENYFSDEKKLKKLHKSQ